MFSRAMKLLVISALAQTLAAQSDYECDGGITPPGGFKCDCDGANTANNAFPHTRSCYYGNDKNDDWWSPGCHDGGVSLRCEVIHKT
ncbi:hypothetical protein BUE80_DR010763 [Diplocarpon rosae]|nr:hypothetical protein BUE80_DR010763 [Diplocarpon rosae]